ncbi:MAG: hypothetical protein ACR2IP_04255, partial [Solirubrobacteraceae bacterium]
MSEKRGEGVSDRAVLIAIATVIALGGLLWMWGGIAGAVFGHGWAGLRAGQVPDVLIGLPTHLSDPADAWPAGVRSQLPGPVGFYAALPARARAKNAMVVVVARGGGMGAEGSGTRG